MTTNFALGWPGIPPWSTDGWHSFHDTETRDTHLGVHLADLPTDRLSTGTMILFTFYWPEEGRWEMVDYSVIVE